MYSGTQWLYVLSQPGLPFYHLLGLVLLAVASLTLKVEGVSTGPLVDLNHKPREGKRKGEDRKKTSGVSEASGEKGLVGGVV